MATTKISWTDRTWSPVTGCSKISDGCKNCYAEVMAKRLHAMGTKGYEKGFEVTLHPERLQEPYKWKKPQKVFVCSMSDLFHEKVPIEFIAKVFATMFLNERHTFQILTKRPAVAYTILKSREFMNALWQYCNVFHDKYIKPLESEMYFLDEIVSLFPFPNIQFGVTIETSFQVQHRMVYLNSIPAKVKFLSVEPMLSEIDIRKYLFCRKCGNPLVFQYCPEGDRGSKCIPSINWVIVGAESGNKAREMNIEWARDLKRQCDEQGVAFWMKQICKNGRDIGFENYPEDLKVREFPNV